MIKMTKLFVLFGSSVLFYSCQSKNNSKHFVEQVATIKKDTTKSKFTNYKSQLNKVIEVTKETKTFKVGELEFKPIWDEKLNFSDNIGYYGGVKTLKIYKNGNQSQTLNRIEDNIALGYIIFKFEDFNLDGFIDFTVPLNEKYPMYYLFNPTTNKYERAEDWDYLRDFKTDKFKKQITTNSYDFDEVKVYKISGLKLISTNE